MSYKIALLSLAAISTLSAQAKILSFDDEKLIYGNDDRYETDAYSKTDFQDLARSVAIRINGDHLSEDRENSDLINFPKRTLNHTMENLCQDERYLNQFSVGDCSGFLIGKNLLMTAGHCMMSEDDCADNKWVFDFKEETKAFQKKNVYSCKRIVAQKYNYTQKEIMDFAVVELDRDVNDRIPLKYRKHGIVSHGTPVVVIGHPLGLPQKIVDGGEVSRMNDIERETKFRSFLLRHNYFTANLDTYAGNSGSPVFNEKTKRVEGIIIQGAEDFIYNAEKDCFQSQRLSNSYHNTYEKVMRMTRVEF